MYDRLRSAQRQLNKYNRINRESGLTDNLRIVKVTRYEIIGKVSYKGTK